MNAALKYPAQVFWSPEDGAYVAIAPDLPGASAVGATKQEALAELDDAIAAWIEAAQGAGRCPYCLKNCKRWPTSRIHCYER